MPTVTPPPDVAQAIRARVADVRQQIGDACRRAGRDPEGVTLIAVSKTFPIESIEAARQAGLRHFGENKAQELAEKAEAMPGQGGGGAIEWHMIGHLQRNKARDVVRTADHFHALDSRRLAKELDKRAAAEERTVPCFVQVNVSGEESKYGLEPDALPAFLRALDPYEHLRVVGLMTLAAPTDDPEEVRPQFRLLRTLAREAAPPHPRIDLRYLSMGMSGDFPVAIEEGATHLRIGSAIFGPRDYA